MTAFFTFVVVTILLILAILAATFAINSPTNDYEKHSAYECGFEPFGDARSFFDVQFYIVGLLFIVFDLEVVFLLPVVANISEISLFGYVNVLIFLVVVTIGFYYEGAIGLLEGVPMKVRESSFSVGPTLQSGVGFPFIFLLSSIDLGYFTLWLMTLLSLIFTAVCSVILKIINLVYLCLTLIALLLLCHLFGIVLVSYVFTFIGAVLIFQLMASIMLPSTQAKSIGAGSTATNNSSIIGASPMLPLVAVEVQSGVLSNFPWVYTTLIVSALVALFKLAEALYLMNVAKLAVDTFRLTRRIYFSVIDFIFKPMGSDGTYLPRDSNIGLWLKRPIFQVAGFFGLNTTANVMRSRTQFPSLLAQLEKRLWVGLYWHDFLYHVYQNVELPLVNGITDNAGSEVVYECGNGFFYNLFVRPGNPEQQKQLLHLTYTPKTVYIPFRPSLSLFNIMPVVGNNRKGSYRAGGHPLALWHNRGIFVIRFVLFYSINGLAMVLSTLIKFVSDLPQLIAKFKGFNLRTYSATVGSEFQEKYAINYPWALDDKYYIQSKLRSYHIPKRHWLGIYGHDFLWYINENILSTLYIHSINERNDLWFQFISKRLNYNVTMDVSPIGGMSKKERQWWEFVGMSINRKFPITLQQIIKNEAPNTDSFKNPLSLYNPARRTNFFLQLIPPKWFVKPGQFLVGASGTIRFINKLIAIKCIITFLVINGGAAVLSSAVPFFFGSNNGYFVLRKLYLKNASARLYKDGKAQLNYVLNYFGINLPPEVMWYQTQFDYRRNLLSNRQGIGVYWHDFIYFIFINVEMPLRTFELELRGEAYPSMFGPYLCQYFAIPTSPAETRKFVPIKLHANSLFIPFRPRYSLFNLFPVNGAVKPGQYFKGGSMNTRILNFLVFLKSALLFFVINITVALATKLSSCVRKSSELLLRNTIYGVYTILIVTPIGVCSNNLGEAAIDTTQKDMDNLIKIKSVLYEYVPTLSFTVVMVLLVALIGAKIVAGSEKRHK